MLGKLTKGTLHVTATVWTFEFKSRAYFRMILSLSHLKLLLAFIALRGKMICEVDNLLSMQQLVYERLRKTHGALDYRKNVCSLTLQFLDAWLAEDVAASCTYFSVLEIVVADRALE